MNRFSAMIRIVGVWGLMLALLAGIRGELVAAAAEDLGQPRILSVKIDGEDLLVEVEVPKGFKRITLESRTRLNRGAWIPRGVERFDGDGGTHTFRLKREEVLEVLRIVGLEEDLLPTEFYGGQKFFAGPSAAPVNALPPSAPGGPVPGLAIDAPAVREPVAAPAPEAAGGDAAAPRDVVESDIWQVDGDRMYFFNQYRGLQVIDISNADSPIITGTLELPASGEQMYVLDDSHVALLARDTCNYFGGGAESRVVIAEVTNGVPAIVASIPVSGSIMESRLVGTALYLASQSFRQFEEISERTGEPEQRWEWGTKVSSHDLSDPGAPVSREELWIPGSGHVIHATSEFLFVSTQGVGSRWWQSRIEVIDISSPDGTLTALSEIRPSGQVLDKFKMHVDGDIFTVISEVRAGTLITRLETYDMSNPVRPAKLGSVEVGKNERLHATRFDGDKAYIVTFFRIDPLWVVDLSDPSNPTISGELEVPGWSTYIQPLGDRLLSIGIDNEEGFRVAVSLFDVRDPANPGLLSRVPLGTNNSWSEANRDEKALGFVPEAGLVMVPFSSYDQGNNRNGVQLVELLEDELVLRGVIEHDVTPRRATLHGDRILSLSGKSLLTVDAADYDQPEIVSDFPLSWAVDRVFVEGEFLIQVTQGNPWSDEAPAIRVAAQADPYDILSQTVMPNPNVVASTVRDGRLYLVQANQNGNFPVLELVDDAAEDEGQVKGEEEKPAAPANFRLSVYDVSALPALPMLGELALHVEGAEGASNPQILFPYDDVLTVSMWQNNYYFGGPIGIGIVADVAFARPFFGGGSSGRRFVSFGVGDPAAMSMLSNYTMETGDSWSLGEVFASGPRFYMSHQASRFVGDIVPPEKGVDPVPPIAPGLPVPEGDEPALRAPEPFPDGTWLQQYFLDVVDFTDPVNPTERKPVNIPGTLVGIARGGALLYTKGQHWDEETLRSDGLEWLDASAYDGVSVSLVDSMSLSYRWPHPTLVDEDTVYVGLPSTRGNLREGEVRQESNSLTAYRLADTGTFETVSQVALPFAVSELQIRRDLLLARVNQEMWFYDLGQPGELVPVGAGSQSNCFGFNLTNADGSTESGLWVPGGDYGISHIPLGENLDRVVAVHGGTFFGHCLGYCETRIEVQPGHLAFSAFSRDNSVRDFYNSQSIDSDEWRKLLDGIDLQVLGSLPTTIGCPDCADGGGEWLQVFTPMGEARITFPHGEAVEGAMPLVERLREFRARFKLPEQKEERPIDEPGIEEPKVPLPPIPVLLPVETPPIPVEPALVPVPEGE
jgi:hypothetical protein